MLWNAHRAFLGLDVQAIEVHSQIHPNARYFLL
jgi:hypothetical protein